MKLHRLLLWVLLQGVVRGFVPLPPTRTAARILLRLEESEDDAEQHQPVDPFKYYNSNNSTRNDSQTQQFGLGEAQVLKKKKRGRSGYKGYKVTDNRDNLPFVVKLTTPDPYTKPEVKKELARKNTVADRKKNRSKTKGKPAKFTNLRAGGVAASIFEADPETGDLLPVLGEFSLDKSTTSGDVVLVGEQAYRVEIARCQYKYAGGQKFEMVRKILEVKPITRVAEEAVLQRSLKQTVDEQPPPMLE